MISTGKLYGFNLVSLLTVMAQDQFENAGAPYSDDEDHKPEGRWGENLHSERNSCMKIVIELQDDNGGEVDLNMTFEPKLTKENHDSPAARIALEMLNAVEAYLKADSLEVE